MNEKDLNSSEEEFMLEEGMERYYDEKLGKKLFEVIHSECERIRKETSEFEQSEASENISDILGKKRMVF